MIISFVQILQESVSKLLPGGEKKATELPPAAIAALLGTVVLKGIIGLGCVRIKTTQVQALAQGELHQPHQAVNSKRILTKPRLQNGCHL